MHFFLADENTTLEAYGGKPVPAPSTVEMPQFVARDVHLAGGAPFVSPAELGLGTDGEFQVRLDAPNEAQRLNGHLIMGLARAAVRDDDRSEFGLLAAAFHQLVLRLPEVHEYLDSLPRHEAETTDEVWCARPSRWRSSLLRIPSGYVGSVDFLRRLIAVQHRRLNVAALHVEATHVPVDLVECFDPMEGVAVRHRVPRERLQLHERIR